MKPGSLIIDFFVPFEPAVAGNKMPRRSRGRIFIVERTHEKTKSWKFLVALYAQQIYKKDLIDESLEVTFVFYRTRPKSHYGTGKNSKLLKPSAPDRPNIKPDSTKLVRSTEDALSGVVWTDDARIVDHHIHKDYADRFGCRIIARIAKPLPERLKLSAQVINRCSISEFYSHAGRYDAPIERKHEREQEKKTTAKRESIGSHSARS